jgi:hypothetical protein
MTFLVSALKSYDFSAEIFNNAPTEFITGEKGGAGRSCKKN